MKYLLPILLAVLAGRFPAVAQPAPPALRIATSAFFYQLVGVRPYQGRPYRLTLRVRADTTDGSWASVGLMYLGQRHFLGFADLHDQKPPRRVFSPQWQAYMITGGLPTPSSCCPT